MQWIDTAVVLASLRFGCIAMIGEFEPRWRVTMVSDVMAGIPYTAVVVNVWRWEEDVLFKD